MRHLKGVPKTHVYRIIRSGEVRVNKGRAHADTRLAAEKLVERRKIEIKEQAVTAARRALDDHIAGLNGELAPMRLQPVTADGQPDAGRPVLFVGQTQILTPMGALPLNFIEPINSVGIKAGAVVRRWPNLLASMAVFRFERR